MTPIVLMPVLAIGLGLLSAPARAATVSGSASANCDIAVTGIIERGDDEKLRRLQAATGSADRNVLCLDSPGGSLPEAIRISQYVHEEGIATFIDEDARCESACSIIFFMGTRRVDGAKIIDRRVAAGGLVGIHAPGLNIDRDRTFDGDAVMQAFAIAMEAAGSVTTLGQEIDGKSGDNWIPVEVVNHLLTTPYTEMFFVTEVGQAQDWNIGVADLTWPETLPSEFVWNMCNFGVRQRMGWSHVRPTRAFDDFRQSLNGNPVGLVRRHLVGQGETEVAETYTALSAYDMAGLRYGCVIDVSYPVVTRSEFESTICVTVLPDGADTPAVNCDNPGDSLVIDQAVAGYAPSVKIDAIQKADVAMMETGLPDRAAGN